MAALSCSPGTTGWRPSLAKLAALVEAGWLRLGALTADGA